MPSSTTNLPQPSGSASSAQLDNLPNDAPRSPSNRPTKRKRRRSAEPSADPPNRASTRAKFLRKANLLRSQGIIPQVLFFPSLPPHLTQDAHIRRCIPFDIQHIKTVVKRGVTMAWLTFSSETQCLEALLRLRTQMPSLQVSFHKPKENVHPMPTTLSPQENYQHNLHIFQTKISIVTAKGGLGNTLMFNNLPMQVDCDEFAAVLRSTIQQQQRLQTDSHQHSNFLRVRTAISKAQNARNFWATYSSIESCRNAFCLLHRTPVTFRCGKTLTLHSFVHDDSTDKDETKRRERAAALPTQPSSGCVPERAESDNIQLLEHFLLNKFDSFVFLQKGQHQNKSDSQQQLTLLTQAPR